MKIKNYASKKEITELGVRELNLRRRVSDGTHLIENEDMSLQRTVAAWLSTLQFDIAIGLVIMLNAITIGIESSAASRGEDTPVWVDVCELLCVVIYAAELGLRLYAFRWEALQSW